jgi:outer membrane lipoprotein-sorting protein
MSVDDRARGTQNFYRLARTPLAPILAETTNLTSEDLVRDVILDREEFIVLVLATADDGSWLSLYFDRQTYDLRQWVTVDARGNTITFVMYETEINQPVDGDYFRILNFRGSG